MKSFILNQMSFESKAWKESLEFCTVELADMMNRMVDVLKNTEHMFIIEKIEQFQQTIIVQDDECKKMYKCIDAHEFRIQNIKPAVNDSLLKIMVLQHQSYRNENELIQKNIISLKMEFNCFFVDQLNSISEQTLSEN
jgi:UDP-N-acetyl-D-mannosaminuronate dehydrogenase